MSVTPQEFRQRFRAFADTDRYPDLSVGFWLGVAQFFINARRWGEAPVTLPDGSQTSLADYGTMLVAAHNLALEARDIETVEAGGVPGEVRGPVGSKGVGPASMSYDVAAVALERGGDWNATRYGITYLRIARMIGAGTVQVGTGPGNFPTVPYAAGVFWQVL